MLKTALGFMRGMGTLGLGWQLWIALLLIVNVVVPLFFLETLEAKLVLLAISIGAVIQMSIFRARGFVKLLGIGHLVPWTPLLLWLVTRLPTEPLASNFGRWLVAVLVLDTISYVIDAVDVVRYARGEKAPTLTLEEL